MIEPILSLAFSIHSNKGVCALLIGSGVSRSAGIPTGWEIVLDFIRKLAHLKGEDCEPNPAAWYRGTFAEESDYSKLLDTLAKSPAERSQLLKGYFEPSEEEREQGLKVPTEAHKAIAEMVASGHIRVIVTTNFDRLLEKALEAVDVVPRVISTPDAVEGALPLTHVRCSIIKVNGDYLDTRIKNTPAELEQYDERLDRLLDRIFDEFGLLVCGWSADWDTALRAALERCKNHRFTTFWTVKGEVSEAAKRLIKLRRAEIVRIQNADSFFQELAEKVSALEELAKPHPLSAKVAVASLKKYLVDDHHKIHLHDLVKQETERLYGELSEERFPVQDTLHVTTIRQRIQHYESLTEIALAVMITGCYWGEESHDYLWTECLERIANPPRERSGLEILLRLRLYPALLLLYGGGIASIAAKRYGTFSGLLTKARAIDPNEERPLVLSLYAWAIMEQRLQQQVFDAERVYTPLSNHLYDILREPLKEFLPQDIDYQKCFDRFEYLLSLVHTDLHQKQKGSIYVPIGCFCWRNLHHYHERSIIKEIESETKDIGKNWPPLQVGLFDGSIEKFQSIKTVVDRSARSLGWC